MSPPHRRHECHALDCKCLVPPSMLMCAYHWRLVPEPLKKAVWRTYVAGQEIRKDSTDAYLDAAQDAIRAVAQKEKRV